MHKVRIPSYMRTFKCIAGACEDTCCAGWYIAVDEGTYKKYKKVKDVQIKKRLDQELVLKKHSVSDEEAAKIKLKNNRCAFLSKDGLCDIYTQLGENYLSHTCRLYPRNINKLNDILEYSLTFSCPEAARKILLPAEGIKFLEAEVDECERLPISVTLEFKEGRLKQLEDLTLKMRQQLIAILQNRQLPFTARWRLLERIMLGYNEKAAKRDFKSLEKLCQLSGDKVPSDTKGTYTKFIEPLELLEALKAVKENKKWQGKGYEAFYETMLGLMASKGESDFKRELKASIHQYVEPFMEEKSFIFENYFVNYIYERLIPLDAATPKESLKLLQLYRTLLMLHLGVLPLEGKKLDEEGAVRVIQILSKNFDHNELYRIKLLKELKKKSEHTGEKDERKTTGARSKTHRSRH